MTFGSKMTHPSSKARISALEKLKHSNAAKLELETRKMEERIRSLKEKMMREKEERERFGGSRWTSGRAGPLTKTAHKSAGSKKNYCNGTANKVPRKIRVLTDEPVDNYIRKPQTISVSDNRVDLCGQCEKNLFAWLCHECSEKYCDACFHQFHSKGALRKHSKTKIETETAKRSDEPVKPQLPDGEENSCLKSNGNNTDTEKKNCMISSSLLTGSYNENESAASFAQALQEWRNKNQSAKQSPANRVICNDAGCGTPNGSITALDDKRELKIKFNSSISYGDRLFLKKSREHQLARTGEVNESGTKEEREAKNTENERKSDVENEENNNKNGSHHFTPNYREMIQNISAPVRDSSFHEDVSFRRNISVQELSPVEYGPECDQATTCIVEESEEKKTEEARPTSRRGAVTICEMFSSAHSNSVDELDLHSLDAHNYVSPSLTSKPFFLKPTGAVKKKTQTTRTLSAGRKHLSSSAKEKKTLNKDQQCLQHLSHKKDSNYNDSGLLRSESVSKTTQTSNKSDGQLLNKDKEGEEIGNTCHYRQRTPLSIDPSLKNKTKIPIRQPWKRQPRHQDLSEFFLAGVDGNKVQQNEDVRTQRTSSTPITSLGRGSLSSTWNPVKSYPSISFNSDDISSPGQAPENHIFDDERYLAGALIDNNSVDLTSQNFEDLKELPERTKEISKNNSSNKDELLQLTALDDFGTGNQEDDDLETLNDLAWELASSTGRLTRCEEDFNIESGDDSTEDKDGGSGLTTSGTLERSEIFGESIMDDFEEMERKFMEEDL